MNESPFPLFSPAQQAIHLVDPITEATTIRRGELAKLQALAEGAREGALLIVGERGSGKTRLLGAIESVASVVIHRVRINPTEAGLPHSGLSAVLASFHEAEAMALSERLLAPQESPPHIGAQASELLAFFHQAPRPSTLLLIDDLDLMDETSQTIIAMVASRLGGSRLRLVGAVSNTPKSGPLASLPRLKLAPLGYADSTRLLSEPEQPQMVEAVRQIVVAESNGNPGALVHNARLLTAEQLTGDAPVTVPFRLSRSSADASDFMLDSASASRRVVLAQLSCSRLASYEVIAQRSGVATDVLDELLADGTVAREGRYIRIRDPLLRSRVYWSLGSASRTDYHATAARAEESLSPGLAVWHDSWLRPAHVTSDELLSAARHFVQEGLVGQAIEMAERALAIDRTTPQTSVALFELAHAMFLRGELAHAGRYARLGQRQPAGADHSSRLAILRTRIEFMSSQQLLTADLDEWVSAHSADDPNGAAYALANVAILHAERWEADTARECLSRARQLQNGSSTRTTEMIRLASMCVATMEGDPTPATKEFEYAHHGAGGVSIASLIMLGRNLTFVDRYGDARRIFKAIISQEPAPDPIWLETTKYAMAENDILAGNQFEAVATIDRLHEEGTAAQIHRNAYLLLMSWYWQAKENLEEAAAAIAECHRNFASGDNPALAARLEAYQGSFALMRGNLEEAIAFLRSTASFASNLRMPALLRHQVDLIEAYVLAGRLPEAMAQFQEFRARSTPYRTQWTMLAAARAHALVAPGESSIGAFQQAIRLWRPGDSQFELGRILLSYGDRLASLGQAQEAREQYLAARIIFTQLGATSWAKKADTSRPNRSSGSDHPLMATLTWDERTVANMVCQGLRNKEIAAALFVSLRTVEVRLTKIYHKLNVRSRAQLIATLSNLDSPLADDTVDRTI